MNDATMVGPSCESSNIIDDDDESIQIAEASSMIVELRAILHLGWPNSVSYLASFIPGLAVLSFLGSNAEHLAAAGMGFMFANVSGISMIMGFGAGEAPLISQAFGASCYARCGDLLQRQIALHMVVALIVAILWMNTELILLRFGQPPGVAELTGQFMRWRIAALPFYALKEDFTWFLVAQRVMWTPMVISVVANALNIILFPPMIVRLGFIGAPLAMTVANIVHAVLLMLFARRALPSVDAWPVWCLRTAFTGWGEILRIAMPAMVMMLAEWWGWEMNLFFAGLLCNTADGKGSCVELDVFPIVSNTMVVAFMAPIGFSIAAGTHIGNALGAGDPAKARRTSNTTLLLASMISGVISLSLVLLRWNYSQLFSSDFETIQLTVQVIPLVAVYIFLDSLGPGALIFILRGMGLVRLPAVINFVSFYFIGIPFGLYLTFGRRDEHWGIFGLWIGLVLGMFTMVIGMLVYLCCCVNWHQAAENAQTLAQGTSETAQRQDIKLEKRVVGKQSYRNAAQEDSQDNVAYEYDNEFCDPSVAA